MFSGVSGQACRRRATAPARDEYHAGAEPSDRDLIGNRAKACFTMCSMMRPDGEVQSGNHNDCHSDRNASYEEQMGRAYLSAA